ncbi:MAG: Crp/Fnr family transcriptional regulator [Coriobacteriales bacterium]|jgi:CRP-like cAMP-binding protein|nr:Crp/Fnr family transcriptional regulator [Coriobacteriales bacterium]
MPPAVRLDLLPGHLETLGRCALFDRVGPEHLIDLLGCLGALRHEYRKGTFVLAAGQPVRSLGIVLEGAVNVVQEDYWGNRNVVSHCVPSDLFAESFCCAGVKQLPVSVVATEQCEVLFIDFGRIINVCTNACSFHNGLVQNMLQVLAVKSVALTQKLEDVTQRTTREKILSYLSRAALAAGESGPDAAFVIPYNRQELADYLSVDRSALSAELSRMAQAGLLRYDRNRFELLSSPC